MKVYWAVLMERSIQEYAVASLLNVAQHAGKRGYDRIVLPYVRTDVGRNLMVKTFLELTSDPDDTLIMLDADHAHPADILERLAAHAVGVVGALAFKRGEPYSPCFFVRGEDDEQLYAPAEWDAGSLIPCVVVGTGAIAIKRWVFVKLQEGGEAWPFFRYYYPPQTVHFPTEDVYFGQLCDGLGIPHHCDTALITPHLTVNQVDETSWQGWIADHPEMVRRVERLAEAAD